MDDIVAEIPIFQNSTSDIVAVLPEEISVVTHCLSILLSLVCNLSLIIIVLRIPKLQTPGFLLMATLAGTDVVLALVWNVSSIAVILRPKFSHSYFNTNNSPACIIIGLLWQIAASMSTLLQGAISCERYLFIVHPFKYQRHVTCKRTAVCCAAIFLVAASPPTVLTFAHETYRLDNYLHTCTGSSLWLVFYLALEYFPSLAVILFSCQRIWALYHRLMHQMPITRNNIATISETGGVTLNDFVSAMNKESKIKETTHICTSNFIGKTPKIGVTPAVKITVCEKEGGIGTASSFSNPVKDPETCSLSYPFTNYTPSQDTSSYSRCSSTEPTKSDQSSAPFSDQLSRSVSIAETTSQFLSPYPFVSHRPSVSLSVTSDTSFGSCRSYSSTGSSFVGSFLPHTSKMGKRDLNMVDDDHYTLVSSANSESSLSVPPSVHSKQSFLSRVFNANPDNAPVGPMTIANAFGSFVIPHVSHVQPCFKDRNLVSPMKKIRKKNFAALHWAAVGNPVITFMMADQSDCIVGSTKPTGDYFKTGINTSSELTRSGSSRESSDTATRLGLVAQIRLHILLKITRAKAFFCFFGPFFLLLASFLPFIIAVFIWESGYDKGQSLPVVYSICLLTYIMTPSMATLILCMTNKPYRKVLKKYIFCRRHRRVRTHDQ